MLPQPLSPPHYLFHLCRYHLYRRYHKPQTTTSFLCVGGRSSGLADRSGCFGDKFGGFDGLSTNGFEVRRLEKKGINLLLFMKKKLGNGLSTLFWDDVWCDGGKLKNRFPRAYALENSKQITVGQKLAHPSLYHSFRRHPRGGLELTQVEELAKVINPVVLTQSPDSWSWTLNNSGGYTVASSRNMIDSRLLPKGDLKTRWIRYVPNKVNTFAWKVMTNSLPTRFNISRRGIDIESLSCVNCDVGIETNDHLFFACNTAKKISKLINRWWDVPFMDINSYGEWRSWIDNVKLPKKNKSMFQGPPKFMRRSYIYAWADVKDISITFRVVNELDVE
ncbi:RNA-directed DNA polymerase, eukaryota, reverse transcriptase zinc-binding domain protein [Tanacetum coccineum]